MDSNWQFFDKIRGCSLYYRKLEYQLLIPGFDYKKYLYRIPGLIIDLLEFWQFLSPYPWINQTYKAELQNFLDPV